MNKNFKSAVVLLCLSLVIVAERLHTYNEPLERDITTYAVIGHELLEGRTLYADLWDHKPPAIYLTYAVGEVIAGYGVGAVYFLNVVAAIVTLLGVYAAGSAFYGSKAGLWAAAFWAVISGDLYLQANQPNTEVFINACLIWSFALLARMNGKPLGIVRPMIIGALISLATLYKQIVVVDAVLLWLAHIAFPPPGLSRRHSIVEVVIMGMIGILAWTLLFGYFWWVGNFREFYDAVFTFNRFYAGNILVSLADALYPLRLLPDFFRFTLPLAIFTFVGLICGVLKKDFRLSMLMLAFISGTLITIASPGQFWPHYYQLWLPPLIVGAVWGIAFLTVSIDKRFKWFLHGVGIVILTFFVYYELPTYRIPANDWSRIKYGGYIGGDFLSVKEMGEYLNRILKPGETFYEWGTDTGLYFYSKRRPPSGVFDAYFLVSGPLAIPLSERVLENIRRKQPELFIVEKREALPFGKDHPVFVWFMSRYSPVKAGFEHENFVLFARSGGPLEKRLNLKFGNP